MSKRAKYVGGHDAGIVPDLIDPKTGTGVEVKQGELVPAHAPADLIDGLSEQPKNWAEHKSPAKADAAEPADAEKE